MTFNRRPIRDPRTVARDIPGIGDILFPQLTPGMVVHLNRRILSCSNVEPVPTEKVEASNLSRAMLFEIGVARGEQMLRGESDLGWEDCLRVAITRQSKHFDVRLPGALSDADKEVADWVAQNMAYMFGQVEIANAGAEIQLHPRIYGFQWISSSEGDFSIGEKLIEVKCGGKRFGSADYRQVLMYWLLSYAAKIEKDTSEWSHCILLNPRLNHLLEISFDEIIGFTTAGKSKIELLELFTVVVGDYGIRASSDIDR